MNADVRPATAPHVVVINVFFAPYTFGGATVVAEEVSRALQSAHGYQVTAISATSRTDIAEYTVIKTEVDGTVNYLINLPHSRSYAETYNNPKITALVARLLQVIAPDVVHVHCIQDVGAGIIAAARAQSLPVVVSTHDFWWLCERQFMIRMDGGFCTQDPIRIADCKGCVEDLDAARLRRDVLLEEIAKADVITFPSHYAKEISQRSGLRAGEERVWGNGVHLPGPDFLEKQARRRAASNGRLVFGFVGGSSQIKGWPIIRRAFEQIGRDDFDGYLVEGSLDGSWWKDVPLTKLQGNWQVVPRFVQENMDDFYAEIDVLLFMSQWKETFGLTIREALARGIRVIQTDSGGTTEHAAADPARLIPIGAGTERLIPELERVLDTPTDHPAPLPVTSFAEQASEMAQIFAELKAKQR